MEDPEEAGRRQRMLEALLAHHAAMKEATVQKQREEARLRAQYPIWQRDQDRAMQKQAKLQSIKAEESKKELEACTFNPSINKKSKALAIVKKHVRQEGEGLPSCPRAEPTLDRQQQQRQAPSFTCSSVPVLAYAPPLSAAPHLSHSKHCRQVSACPQARGRRQASLCRHCV